MIYKERYNILPSDTSPNLFRIATIGKGSVNKTLRDLYTTIPNAIRAIDKVLTTKNEEN